ncbi:MAG: ribosome maturation factor RimM [Bryobacteraceae bacterium]
MAIAVIVGARGNRGEVAAVPLSNRPERFARTKRVFLFGGDGSPAGSGPFDVEDVWEHRGRVIFKFRGVDTISDAERLRGAEVRIPSSERDELPVGEYYQSDLIGCELADSESGQALGRVEDWQDFGGSGLLAVRAPDGEEFLIPFARSICVDINVEERRITVKLPEGLKDLNRK